MDDVNSISYLNVNELLKARMALSWIREFDRLNKLIYFAYS
jgi:hypothetical protein